MKQIKTKSGTIGVLYSDDIIIAERDFSKPKSTIKYLEDNTIGILSELTDKDCEEFVEITHYGGVDLGEKITQRVFKDYLSKNKISKLIFKEKESFISLLQSEGIDTSKELLIIKIL